MTLSVSTILSAAYDTARRRFWPLAGMYLTWFLIMIAFSFAFMVLIGGSVFAMAGSLENSDAIGAGMGAGMILALVLFYVAYLAIVCAQNAAMCTLASPLRDGGFGQAFNTGLRSALPLLGVMILLVFAYFAVALVLGIVVGVLAQLGSIVSVLATIAIFGVILWLVARIGIVFAVVPVDGVRNPIRAIAQAWNLTSGHALPIFLSFVVLVVIAVVLFGVMAIPFIGALTAMGGNPDPSDIGAVLSGMGLMIFVFIIGVIVLAVFYAALVSGIHGLLAGETESAATFE